MGAIHDSGGLWEKRVAHYHDNYCIITIVVISVVGGTVKITIALPTWLIGKQENAKCNSHKIIATWESICCRLRRPYKCKAGRVKCILTFYLDELFSNFTIDAYGFAVYVVWRSSRILIVSWVMVLLVNN